LILQLETLNDQLVRSAKQTEDWESDANRLAQVGWGSSKLTRIIVITVMC
jgi:hypothetical protein